MISNNSSYTIGVDVGTTSIKSVLLNNKGEQLASVMKEYTLDSDANDTCELNPDVYWDITCQVICDLLKLSDVSPQLVKGVAFSSQGETLIVVDKNGIPLRKAIVWLDNRSVDEAKQIEEHFGNQLIINITGQPEVVPTWPATRLLWLQKYEPEVFKNAFKYLLVEDYLMFKMTGKYCTEHSLVSSTLYFDINKLTWWSEMLQFLGVTQNQLPEVLPSGVSIGYLSVQAASATGLTTNTQCVTGAYDHPAGAIGAGSVMAGDVTLTIGASMAMCVSMTHPVTDTSLKIPCQCHAVDGLYFLLPYGQTAGMVLKWFRDEFYSEEMKQATVQDIDPYDIMVAQAQAIPIGADGLIMLPHLMGAGSPEFNPEAKGVFAGVKMGMNKGHFTRAILESVVCMIHRNIQIMMEQGISIREINVLGGGSKSELWVQMLANMTGISVNTLMISDNAATGAALLAGVGVGVFNDLNEACRCTVKSQTRFEPDSLEHEQYQKVYNKYIQLYQSLESYW